MLQPRKMLLRCAFMKIKSVYLLVVWGVIVCTGCTTTCPEPPGWEPVVRLGSLDDPFPIIQPFELIELKIGLYQSENAQKQSTLKSFFGDLKPLIESNNTSVEFSYRFIPDQRKFLIKARRNDWDIDWVGEYTIVSSDWINPTWGEVIVYNEYVYSVDYIGSRRTDGDTARNEIRNRVALAIGELSRQDKYRERMVYRGMSLTRINR